ncbi:MAG: hypothetical protein KAT17_09505 [Candidatus Aminicenantes bacterium]|nr:hypothetical protein [Candidatus Aminicenantes bacterium]
MLLQSAILILFSLFLNFSTQVVDSNPAVWWTIELDISVQGKYQFTRDQKVISGSYQFRLFYQGAMERDNGDYILYQGESRVNILEWNEKVDDKIISLNNKLKPRIKLNYVIRKNKHIQVDFETYLTFKYFNHLGKAFKISLPCSAENHSIRPESRYNIFVKEGSNKISVPENRIYKQDDIHKVFRWDWEKIKSGKRQDHSVVLALKITKKKKLSNL